MTTPKVTDSVTHLIKRYQSVRDISAKICEPLETEDYVIQAIEDVSPPKWHLAHTTWFFEQVLLEKFIENYIPYHPVFYYLFNSYYNSFGDRAVREDRGIFSRPTVSDVYAYRKEIDKRMIDLIQSVDQKHLEELSSLIVLGLHHEQQHQELLLADIKWNFYSNPMYPQYRKHFKRIDTPETIRSEWAEFEGGLIEVGYGGDNFSFDNERPKHRIFQPQYKLMNRLITCGEYLEFIQDNGYKNPALWLDDGWTAVQSHQWYAPQYWVTDREGWKIFTFGGLEPLSRQEPVSHISFFEADAFARWAGAKLPTEFEWEHAANTIQLNETLDNFYDNGVLRPLPAEPNRGLQQMFGDVWEWTSSAYLPYPGYQQVKGPLGEYNGKFMNGQMVCRGGSAITSRSHFRKTYRNFFQPDKRWIMHGFRLSKLI